MELWRVSIQTGKAERLRLVVPNLTGIAIHPDGQRLAFTGGESVGELWVFDNFLPAEALERTNVVARKRGQ